MKAKTAIGVTTAVTATSYLAYKTISNEFFKKVFNKDDHDRENSQEIVNWFNNSNKQDCFIESYDGLKLHAYKLDNHDTNNYIIMIHGINSNSSSMLVRAFEFDKLGYNTFLIDQRAAGLSKGKYYTYGMKESLDLTLWIDYLIKENKDINICLYGVSMGAATVMMSLAHKLPSNVKCVIEDCGFSTLKDEIKYVIKRDYGLQYTKVLLDLIEKRMIEKFGFNYDDISVKNALDENEIPIMFIHGMSDDLVPYEMSKILYNHNKGYKKFYPVPNVGHSQAIQDEKYFDHLDEFVKKFFE